MKQNKLWAWHEEICWCFCMKNDWLLFIFLHLRPYSLNIKFELGICCIYWTYCETACQFVPYLFFFKCLTSFSNNNWWLLFWNIFHRKRDPRVAYFNGPCCRCQKHGCESDNRSCASWDVASASEKHWRTTFNVITSPEVKLWRFVVLGNRQLAVKPFSAHPGSSFCLPCFYRVNMDMYGYSGVFLVKRFLDNEVFEVTNMSDINKANPHGCDNGALTDRFGVLIQGLLAIVAFSTLMCEYLNR